MKPFAPRSIRSRPMPVTAAVRTSRSPYPNTRPNMGSVSLASVIRSSDASVARLLTTPRAWMIRRFVSTTSSLWNARAVHPIASTPYTTSASVR